MDNTNQRTILTYAVLIGLTPLIPLPLLDDLTRTYFQRKLVTRLAQARRRPLSSEEIAALADTEGGCLRGCLDMLLLYPIKAILRKFLYVLEVRRAINLISHSYYDGYLLDYALKEGWYLGDEGRDAARVRAAINDARAGANIDLLNRVVRETFNRQALMGIVQSLSASLRAAFRSPPAGSSDAVGRPTKRRRIRLSFTRRSRRMEEVSRTMERIKPEERPEVVGVVTQMEGKVGSLPSQHIESLQQRLAQALQK